MARPSRPVAWVHLALFRLAATVLTALPTWMFVRTLAAFGGFAYLVLARHRDRTLDNVRQAYPATYADSNAARDADEAERLARFVRRNFRYTFLSFADILHVTRQYRPSNWMRHTPCLIHPRAYDLMTRPHRPGLLTLSGHFGPWERAEQAFTLLGFPHTVVVRPLDSYLVDEHIEALRARHGTKVLSKFGAFREQMRIVHQGETLAVIADQDAGVHARGVFVRFFGRWCKATDAVAVLAIRAQTPILLQMAIRLGYAPRSIQVFEEPIETAGLDPRSLTDVTHVVQRFHDVLEKYVRAFPEQYMWMHKKWRTRPLGEPGADPRFVDQQPQARRRSPYTRDMPDA